MNILHPPIESIQRGYAAWLTPPVPSSEETPERESFDPEIQGAAAGFAAAADSDAVDADIRASLEIAPIDDASLPAVVAEAIGRQVAAQPVLRAPQPGDLIVLPPPAEQAANEPGHPVAMVLDDRAGSRWHGWLVGAHVDYAGDRDLVLEASLIEGGKDPAPIAGMVMCWDSVSLELPTEVRVVHRLNVQAMQAIAALARGDLGTDAPPAPGRMCIREIGEAQVMTGTPYLRDDPRTPYLRLARELARRVSEPEYDDQGQVRGPRRDGPESESRAMKPVPVRDPAWPVAETLGDEGLLLGWSLAAKRTMDRMGFAPPPETAEDRLGPILHNDGGHLMSFAPTGAGKGIGAVIPALLSYAGPVIVVDPKGENYAVTARHRREMGHQVICLDPFDSIRDEHADAAFNPLDLLDPASPNVADDAMMLAEALSYQTTMDKDPFWHTRGKQLLAGFILHVASGMPPQLRTLEEVAYQLNQTREDLKSTFMSMAKSPFPLVKATPAIIAHSAQRMADSILAMSQTNLSFLGSKTVEAATESSSFDPLAVTRGEPLSIYLIIPPEKLESHAPLLRIWIAALMKLIFNRREKVERPTLFILDEAAQLGNFPPLRQAITLLRGYGLQTWSFWQDLSQLKRLYGEAWETMYNNCRAHQYFGITTPYLAEQIARLTLHEDMFEILDLDHDEMLLSLAGRRPIIAQRPNYLTDTPFQGRFDPNPYHQPKDLDRIKPRRGQRDYQPE